MKLDDKDEFLERYALEAQFRGELQIHNLGPAVFTNQNLMGMWLARQGVDGPEKLKAFYGKYSEYLDATYATVHGDVPEKWVESMIEKALKTNTYAGYKKAYEQNPALLGHTDDEN